MTQLLRIQNFMLSEDGFGSGEGQSLERPFGHADPVRLCHLGRRDRALAQPHRPRRHPRPRRLLHPRLHQQHRRRDHGAQQIRSAARPVGGRGVAGMVGRRPAVPHAGVRPHPPRATVVHARRHHLPLHRRLPAEALAQAKAAADGKDVRLGGGVQHVREFLDADLVAPVRANRSRDRTATRRRHHHAGWPLGADLRGRGCCECRYVRPERAHVRRGSDRPTEVRSSAQDSSGRATEGKSASRKGWLP